MSTDPNAAPISSLMELDNDEALRPYAADEVLQYLEKRRGNYFLAAAAELLAERYAAIVALYAERDRLTHALTACQQCQAGHELDCAALTMRAEKAEARMKEERDQADEFQRQIFVLQRTELRLLALNSAERRATPGVGWIKVAERLPEDPSYCIVVDKRRQVHELEFNGGHWWTEQADGPMPADAFTHWLPIPEAPQAAPAS